MNEILIALTLTILHAGRPLSAEEAKIAKVVCAARGGIARTEADGQKAWAFCNDGTSIGLWKANRQDTPWGQR